MMLLQGYGLWYSPSLSTIFQVYRGDQFYWLTETRVPRENYKIIFPDI
jgi:hypothetical protein